ncbi:hypothetical protein [Actinomadura chibensis]|uniref:Uncharacterized protein n=1 Tax=Actinomadura chibensis TaxID=392828 RepID=A0A5D0NZL1_9ACTN|nr:hypothetical protein [Actinomadura chibensis]TYB49584.1 hypothetical protein FXF69_11050 [Actinomadura chibensis]
MSPRPPHPGFRTARAVVFATVCVVLATSGHVLASGAPVPVWTAGAGFCAVLGVTLMLAGHERSLPTILGGLLGGQFALHTLFTAATTAAGPVQRSAAVPHDPAMHGPGAYDPVTPGSALHATGADVLTPVAHGSGGIAMTLAHTIAALAAAWWLRRGERAAWALARRVAGAADRPIRLLLALLAVAARPAAGPPRAARAVPAADAAPAVGRVLRHQVVRRGPPPRSRALAVR